LVPLKKKADPSEGSDQGSVLVQDANIWTGTGLSKGSILIDQGKIQKIARRIETRGGETINASGLLALPGLVDVHVHLRDMDLAHKEDFASGTAAAAAGGFTSLLDMPNTQPPTDSPRRLAEKQEKAAAEVYVNVGFHVAAVPNSQPVQGMASLGAFSLKLYMPKPISRLNVKDDVELLEMMKASRDAGLPVTVHAEDPEITENASKSTSFLEMAKARSPESESKAVERIIELQKKSRCQVHFCHLTLSSSLNRIGSAAKGMTTEVTPHHVLLSQNHLSRLGWRAWMVPPLRLEKNRRELLKDVATNAVTVVASDHAPHTIEEKDQPPRESPPGVPGLETTLRLLLTLVNKRVLNLSHLVKLLASNPAQVFGLRTKGKLRPGADGDVVLVDMKKKTRIDSTMFFSKAKFSPFDGFLTKGAVHSTIVNGMLVYHDGEIVARRGSGQVLRRKTR